MPAEPSQVDLVFGEFLGIPAHVLLRAGVSVVPHAALGDWNGAWVFRREEAVVISVPRRQAEAVRRNLDKIDGTRIHEPQAIAALFGERIEVVGPAFWGVVEPVDFVPFRPDAAGPVRPDERTHVEAFARDVDRPDWDAAGIRSDDPHLCVSRAGDRIAAIAGWRRWKQQPAGDPGVVTHPAHRGKGHGTAVTSAVVGRALQRGELALYQTLHSNERAVAIARTLGFHHYATHLAIRLKP